MHTYLWQWADSNSGRSHCPLGHPKTVPPKHDYLQAQTSYTSLLMCQVATLWCYWDTTHHPVSWLDHDLGPFLNLCLYLWGVWTLVFFNELVVTCFQLMFCSWYQAPISGLHLDLLPISVLRTQLSSCQFYELCFILAMFCLWARP